MLSFTKKANQNQLSALVAATDYGLPPLVLPSLNMDYVRQESDSKIMEQIRRFDEERKNNRTFEQILNDYRYTVDINDMYRRYGPRP